MKNVIIFGCGGHSRSVVDVLLSYQKDCNIFFIDENASLDERIFNFPVMKYYNLIDEVIFIALGNNFERKQRYDFLQNRKLDKNLINIISPLSYIGREVNIGLGCFIGNYCHIGPYATIGDNTVINHGASIDHEVIIGNHCHIGPNATISGRSKIGDLVFLGVGSTVVDKITICSNVTIGAGAVVVKDIMESGTYVGVPAVKVK